MSWLYDGEPIRTDPETFFFWKVVDGGTHADYAEWLMAAIKSRRLAMTEEREREFSGRPAPIQAEKG